MPGASKVCLKDHIVLGAGKIQDLTAELVADVYGVPVEIVHHKGCPIVVPLHNENAA